MALAAFALVLLPGLLVVRAPWTMVAPLSLAFWVTSAWWPPLAGAGRSRVLASCLAAALLLALLRLLPKHEVAPPTGWQPPPARPLPPAPGRPSPRLVSGPSLVVLTAALALLAPLPLWHHAPGQRLAFQTTMARLHVWRDGVPASAEPLIALAPMGAHAPALATLAADVAHLTGLDPGPALLAVVAAATGLVVVGLFALHAVWAPSWAAAAGALVGLAASPWPRFLSLLGEGEALLALGLVLPAAALLVGRASRASAVAAAFLLAAGGLAQPLVAAAAAALSTAVVLGRRPAPRRVLLRLAAASLVTLLLAAPGLWPLARALSAREALAIATSDRVQLLAPFASGLLLCGLAPLAFVRAARARSRPTPRALVAAAGLAALLLVVRVHGWFAAGQLDAGARAALGRVARETAPLALVCAPEGVRDFVPALAGRGAGEPGVWIPTVYSDEWSRRERRACAARLDVVASSR